MRCLLFAAIVSASAVASYAQNPVEKSREKKVRDDRARVEREGYWIYGDLQKGVAEARRTRRPIVVTLRCIPCEACVKLDEDVMHADQRLKKLLDQFVRVRIVSTNGLDLSLFQFDTDQSFAMFFLNADGTIYGRFGTRSDHSEWQHDVSFEGLASALEGALELHAGYPQNRRELAGKKGPRPEFASPDKFPQLKDKYAASLDYQGNVVQNCIHCHQIGDAQRQAYLERGEMIPDQLLFSYPHPKAIGLILDPDQRAGVVQVEADSPAEHAGFQPGDRIVSLAGQPLLSLADVQWVLHHADADGAQIPATIERGEETQTLTLDLPSGWRRKDDIGWRVSTWELRRIALGGMVLVPLTNEQRADLNLPEQRMALRVQHVGQYSPHDAAKNSGLQSDDVLISFAGRTDFARETDLLVDSLRNHRAGRAIDIQLLRDGQPRSLKLKLP